MRRSASFLIPISLITLYYSFWIGLMIFLLERFPVIYDYFPLGGLENLQMRSESDLSLLEPVYSSVETTVWAPFGPIKLASSCIGAAILIVPVTWAYFITSRSKQVDQSFVQTIIILPIVVTGISMIVMNSVALAFSLAGIVAAVRFRFTLKQPAHAMYIFCAISIGLGAGIGALGIAAVISMAFVYATIIIWKLEYGQVLTGPFFSMLTRRDRTEEDY